MENGLYLAQFVVGTSAGHGVAVIHDGSVQGGDSSYWWEGTLTTNGDIGHEQLDGHVPLTRRQHGLATTTPPVSRRAASPHCPFAGQSVLHLGGPRENGAASFDDK